MPRDPLRSPHTFSAVRLDRASRVPLHRQIVELLRRDILSGELAPGRRLASTRALAHDLGVSRNTALEAVDQLTAEGYLVGRVGAGTFVVDDLPDDLLRLASPSDSPSGDPPPPISRRGERLREAMPDQSAPRGRPFQLGRPALDLFPWATWRRLLARRARELDPSRLDYSDVAGFGPLRNALARHLRATRGLECSPDQIVVVRGSQQGLDLAARVLLEPGDRVWMEDPGYPAARAAFAASDAREVAIPVDEQGLDVAAGKARAPDARLAYVTPSHQYPLGITMSLSRRLELLRWARRADAWIVEDDYDSEYRFAGRPLASLAGLDRGRHVLYLGTLSKVLFPGLRLGYLVVPLEHADAFHAARYAADRCGGLLEQTVVTDFLVGGHFDRHLRRMRLAYANRQAALHRVLEAYLSGRIELRSSPAGLHDVVRLPGERDDAEVADRAAELGVQVGALSRYCREAELPPALLLGYAGFPPEELDASASILATALARVSPSGSGRS